MIRIITKNIEIKIFHIISLYNMIIEKVCNSSFEEFPGQSNIATLNSSRETLKLLGINPGGQVVTESLRYSKILQKR